jgi:hypothetical protein
VKVEVLNGPNLGRLGTRQTDIYGVTTYADLVSECVRVGKELGLEVEVRQTDAEPEMLGWLHAAADSGAAVVLNPGAWSHYSYAVRDACAMLRARRWLPPSPGAPRPPHPPSLTRPSPRPAPRRAAPRRAAPRPAPAPGDLGRCGPKYWCVQSHDICRTSCPGTCVTGLARP